MIYHTYLSHIYAELCGYCDDISRISKELMQITRNALATVIYHNVAFLFRSMSVVQFGYQLGGLLNYDTMYYVN